MRRQVIGAISFLCVLIAAGRVNAQAVVVSRGGNSASSAMVLSGTIVSSIVVSVNGSANQGPSAFAVISGSGIGGSIQIDTVGVPDRTVRGEKKEIRNADGSVKGSYLVGTVTVMAVFTGAGNATAAFDIQRAAPCSEPPDIPCNALFFALPAARQLWTGYPDPSYGASVFTVPEAAYVPGNGNLAPDARSGEVVSHQLAVWVPNDAPLGAFATLVKYTATLK